MKIYLVGGAVRDEILGLPVKEKDWVVTGGSPQAMEKLGYINVGKSFPVFLHPQTKEEYALARLERKVGPGYQGFAFDTSPDVTLEEDLMRRDLTINAIAMDEQGNFIDPYHGQDDLASKVLRHVSNAFKEDPVRVLRVARFASRFFPLGFTLAPETLAFMQEMAANGEVNNLVPERVWKEMQKALTEKDPAAFFEVLNEAKALAIILPEIYHLYRDDFSQLRKVLEKVVKTSEDPVVRFAVLMSSGSIKGIADLLIRLRFPNEYWDVAHMVASIKTSLKNDFHNEAEILLKFFEQADAFRRQYRFEQILTALANSIDFDKLLILAILEKVKVLDLKEILKNNPEVDIKTLIHQQRLKRIHELLEPKNIGKLD